MDLADEALLQIIMAYDGTHGSLAFVKSLKQTNKRLRLAVRNGMYIHKDFGLNIRNLACHIPGTLIPCNGEHLEDLTVLSEVDEMMEFFLSTHQTAPRHGIAVSGAFETRRESVVTFEWQNDGFLYLSVDINLNHGNLLSNLPLATTTTYDISSVPNVVRQVLGLPERTHDVDEINNLEVIISSFAVIVRVRPENTIGQLYLAVAHSLGWSESPFRVVAIMHGNCNRNTTIAQLRNILQNRIMLIINWPEDESEDDSDDDSDDEDDQDDDPDDEQDDDDDDDDDDEDEPEDEEHKEYLEYKAAEAAEEAEAQDEPDDDEDEPEDEEYKEYLEYKAAEAAEEAEAQDEPDDDEDEPEDEEYKEYLEYKDAEAAEEAEEAGTKQDVHRL